MSVVSKEHVEADTMNVVSLFGRNPAIEEEILNDPMADLIREGEIEDFDLELDLEVKTEAAPRKIVDMNQFPDQSMFVLEEQLASLRSNLNRIKFYLGDLEDLLPR